MISGLRAIAALKESTLSEQVKALSTDDQSLKVRQAAIETLKAFGITVDRTNGKRIMADETKPPVRARRTRLRARGATAGKPASHLRTQRPPKPAGAASANSERGGKDDNRGGNRREGQLSRSR